MSDKWESYFPTYDALLQPFRAKPISLLEIGVQNGGSLEIWAKYLPYARHIVGCDIEPVCGDLAFADPRIRVVVGDANKQPAFDRIAAIARQYAVVIDDGSHRAADVIASLARYFPLVAPGGVYVIEDLHCAYYQTHDSSIHDSTSVMNFLQLLTHVINYEHWRRDMSIPALLHDFFPDGRVPRSLRSGRIHSIAFQNSLAIIRRAKVAMHKKLGRRVIVGESAIVPEILKLRTRHTITR